VKRKTKTRLTKPTRKASASSLSAAEQKKDRFVVEATKRFLRRGIAIKDVYANL
jgi:hypothetical protein